MNKYKVKINHVFSEVINVSANNEEEAKEIALKELEKEEREMKASYEATIPSEHWPVITEEKYNEIVKDVESKLQENKSNIITL